MNAPSERPTCATCATCKWWDDVEATHRELHGITPNEFDAGNCHALAPGRNQGWPDKWPRTNRKDWCGEHAPAPETKAVG